MITDEEIRLECIKMKIEYCGKLMIAGIIANRKIRTQNFWDDGDLEDIYNYVKTGRKPEAKESEI